MNAIQKAVQRINRAQQGRPFLAFSVAVVKKYGEDEAGYKAALLTYYGFLALFPLLLLLTTLTNDVIGSNSHWSQTIIKSITSYFPLLGTQLSSHVHGLHKSGLALLVGVLFTLYGTRGVADAFRHGVQRIWLVPKSQQDGFPDSLFKSFSLIIIGGLGFLLTAVIAGMAASAGQGWLFRVASLVISAVMLFWLFLFLLNFSLPRHVTAKEIRAGAATAAIGLVLLQTLGTYLLARELKSLDALYSYFALALGLLFWIYLQAQLLFYSVEIAVVRSQKLYPRSLSGEHQTAADEQLATLRSNL